MLITCSDEYFKQILEKVRLYGINIDCDTSFTFEQFNKIADLIGDKEKYYVTSPTMDRYAIKEFTLRGCEVDDDVLYLLLGAALNNENIVSMDMRYNNITCLGVRYLTEFFAMRPNQLEWFNICDNEMEEQGARTMWRLKWTYTNCRFAANICNWYPDEDEENSRNAYINFRNSGILKEIKQRAIGR